jgi:phospholipid/cholesterol/gamma-HCH transport system substrate-binding protein
MENRAHALAAGLFTLLLATAAAVAIWWLGQTKQDTSVFLLETRRNVTGLNVEAQVRFRGIRAGKVEDISVDEKDPRVILIRVSVDNRFHLTRGTTAQLGYQGITGLAYVQLEDDGRSPEPLVAGDGGPPRLALKPTALDALSDRAEDMIAQTAKVTENLARLLDEKNIANISRTLENAATASEGLKELPQVMASLRQALSPANMERLSALLAHLEKTAGEAAPLTAEVRDMVKTMTALAARLDRLAADAGGELTANTLPRSSAMLQEVTANARQLSRLLDMLEQNPQALVFGRGEVRPGPGEVGFAAPSR